MYMPNPKAISHTVEDSFERSIKCFLSDTKAISYNVIDTFSVHLWPRA